MSVWRAKQEVTSSEFVRWKVHFEMEWNEPSRTDEYLKLLCSVTDTVRASWGEPKPRMPDEFTLKFKFEVPVEKQFTELTREERVANSKSAWLAATGIKRE